MVDSKRKLAEQAIANARSVLEKGDEEEARKWAEQASQLAPDLEDPWLVLAYLSDPTEGLDYLEKALALNPSSSRARKGIRYLVKKIQDQNQIIPPVFNKSTASDLESPRTLESAPGKIQTENNKISDSADYSSDSVVKQTSPVPEKVAVKSEKIEPILTSEPKTASENKPVFKPQITFSRKQSSESKGFGFTNILILLFGVLVLTLTILMILYANHQILFIK